MYNIAIVDDNVDDIRFISDCVKKILKDQPQFGICTFNNPINFLDNYKKGFDVVFLDVMMPGINGLETAKKIRAVDSNAIIVFITSMVQYAINGYEVDATDYIVKPFKFENFEPKFNRILRKLSEKNETSTKIVIKSGDTFTVLKRDEIVYVESNGHYVIYHTMDNTYTQRENFKDVAAKIESDEFVSCNKGYLLNLKYVRKVDDVFVTIGNNEQLLLSRLKKKTFLQSLANYHLKN